MVGVERTLKELKLRVEGYRGEEIPAALSRDTNVTTTDLQYLAITVLKCPRQLFLLLKR